jgi:hypothetical protein
VIRVPGAAEKRDRVPVEHGRPLGMEEFTAAERALIEAVEGGTALFCNSDSIRGRVIREILIGRLPIKPDPLALQLVGARIVGRFDLRHLVSGLGLTLVDCRIDEPLHAAGARLRLMDLSGSSLPGLYAEGLRLEESVFLRDKCTIAGSNRGKAVVQLSGARIGGSLEFSRDTKVTNDLGPAITTDGMDVQGAVLLNGGFSAIGAGPDGALHMIRCNIGANLEIQDSRIQNLSGPGVILNGLQVAGSVYLRRGLEIAVDDESSFAVSLSGAQIAGDLDCTGGRFANRAGGAIYVTATSIEGVALLGDDFRASGVTLERSTVRIAYSRVGQVLNLVGGQARNPKGAALDLRFSSVGSLRIPPDIACKSGRDDPSTWHPDGTLHLDGLTYRALHADGANVDQWEHWLSECTHAYAAQPYQQLATTYHGAGQETLARRILIAQQRDRRRRGSVGGAGSKMLHWLFGWTVGYGYRASRAMLWLAIVAGAAISLSILASHTHRDDGRYLAIHGSNAHTPFAPCSMAEQVGMGIDRGLPLIRAGTSETCIIDTDDRLGQSITFGLWATQLAAWATATLAVAGYTGLVRKL